jgi:hypothetical protein
VATTTSGIAKNGLIPLKERSISVERLQVAASLLDPLGRCPLQESNDRRPNRKTVRNARKPVRKLVHKSTMKTMLKKKPT